MLMAFVAFGCAPFAAAEQGATTRPADPTLTDLQGVARRPLAPEEQRAVVLIFIRTDCPISNAYAPEINRLAAHYGPEKIGFFVVYAMKDLPESDARQHAKAYGYSCPAIIDRRHELVDAVGATATPEATVIGNAGKLIYRGRIDDLFVALGRQRYQATTHELRDVLDAVLAGRPAPVAFTPPVGCAIDKS
jgi:hypothetical protein